MLYIFDFDLTLVNSSAGIYAAFLAGFKATGLQPPSEAQVLRSIGLPLLDAFLLFGGKESDFVTFYDAFKAESDRSMSRLTHAYPDTLAALESIKRDKENRVGIFSAKDGDTISAILSCLGLEPLVDAVVGYEDITRAKPDGQGIDIIMKEFGFTPADTVYIGDSIIDYRTSLSAGVPFCAVLTGAATEEEFKAAGCNLLAENLMQAVNMFEKLS